MRNDTRSLKIRIEDLRTNRAKSEFGFQTSIEDQIDALIEEFDAIEKRINAHIANNGGDDATRT